MKYIALIILSFASSIKADFVRVNGQCLPCCNFKANLNVFVDQLVGNFSIDVQSGVGNLTSSNIQLVTTLVNSTTALDNGTFYITGSQTQQRFYTYYFNTNRGGIFNAVVQGVPTASFTNYRFYYLLTSRNNNGLQLGYFCRNVNSTQREEEINVYIPRNQTEITGRQLALVKSTLRSYNISTNTLKFVNRSS